jgi:hypothetical protein
MSSYLLVVYKSDYSLAKCVISRQRKEDISGMSVLSDELA